jgi:hypothetical protein
MKRKIIKLHSSRRQERAILVWSLETSSPDSKGVAALDVSLAMQHISVPRVINELTEKIET